MCTEIHTHAGPVCCPFCHGYDKWNKDRNSLLLLTQLWRALAAGFLKMALQRLSADRGLICPLSLTPGQGDRTGFCGHSGFPSVRAVLACADVC